MKKILLILLLVFAFTSCSPDIESVPVPEPVEACFKITSKYIENGSYILESHPYNQPKYSFHVSETVYNLYNVGQDYCTIYY